MQDLSQNYYELFQLPVVFAIDVQLLDQRYRQLQSEIHPDRYAAAAATERMRSMQWATLANEAYRTLKNPLSRARYLLQLHGRETDEESNTAMSADFLMQQMEWRETAEDAKAGKDVSALESLLQEMQGTGKTLQAALQKALDDTHDYDHAAETVRKLSFIEKITHDISHSLDILEEQQH